MKTLSMGLRTALAAALGIFGCGIGAFAQDLIPIRIGWQPTTTVEAQIAHTLAKTDILERNGLRGQFSMFSFGPLFRFVAGTTFAAPRVARHLARGMPRQPIRHVALSGG